MKRVNLDTLDEGKLTLIKDTNYDYIFYVSSLSGANTGDHFLSLYSSPFLVDHKKIAYITHPNHLVLASMFSKYLDCVFFSERVESFLGILSPTPIDIHVCSLHRYFFRDPLDTVLKEYHNLLKEIWNPWNYFLLNQTYPNSLQLNLNASNSKLLENKSVIFFPQRSDLKTINMKTLVSIKEHVESKGYFTYTNTIKNTHFKSPVVVPGTEAISPNLTELIEICQNKDIVLIGMRSGIFDVLYFTSYARMLIFYPLDSPSFFFKCKFNNRYLQESKIYPQSFFRDGVVEFDGDDKIQLYVEELDKLLV